MTKIRVEKQIRVPQEQIWEILANFSSIYQYHPFVPNSYALNAQHSGLGAERRCEFDPQGKKFIDERIIGWREGVSYDVEIYDGTQKPPVNNLVATIAMRGEGHDTIVSFTFSYKPKFGPVGILMDRMMIRKFMKKAAEGVLAGLEHHVTTGETVSSARVLKAASAAI